MRAWLSERVDWRMSLTVAIGVAVATVMIATGMEPRLVLVGFVVAIVSAVAWLAIDLGPLAMPLEWTDHGVHASSAPRSDHRVRDLRRRLRRRRRRTPIVVDTGEPEPADEIVGTLVRVVDDHLAAEFGLDRHRDPEAAAEILGPELASFVGDPAAARSMSGRRSLARTVALIEDLCSRSRAA